MCAVLFTRYAHVLTVLFLKKKTHRCHPTALYDNMDSDITSQEIVTYDSCRIQDTNPVTSDPPVCDPSQKRVPDWVAGELVSEISGISSIPADPSGLSSVPSHHREGRDTRTKDGHRANGGRSAICSSCSKCGIFTMFLHNESN